MNQGTRLVYAPRPRRPLRNAESGEARDGGASSFWPCAPPSLSRARGRRAASLAWAARAGNTVAAAVPAADAQRPCCAKAAPRPRAPGRRSERHPFYASSFDGRTMADGTPIGGPTGTTQQAEPCRSRHDGDGDQPLDRQDRDRDDSRSGPLRRRTGSWDLSRGTARTRSGSRRSKVSPKLRGRAARSADAGRHDQTGALGLRGEDGGSAPGAGWRV